MRGYQIIDIETETNGVMTIVAIGDEGEVTMTFDALDVLPSTLARAAAALATLAAQRAHDVERAAKL